MPKKSHVKKIKYKLACRLQVKEGYINQANGTWAKSDGKAMAKDMFNGYKFGRR